MAATDELTRVRYERRGPEAAVMWLTLDNPGMRNALDDPMQLQLIEALQRMKSDDSVRCVVLRGAGSTFCSGGDISAFDGMSPLVWNERARKKGDIIQSLFFELGKPLIAAAEGWCLAGGLELALMCDFVYASQTAKFGLTEIRLGLLPGWGGLTRLPKVVGAARGREMIYRGEIVDAAEAHRLGIVNRLFPDAQSLYEAVDAVSAEIASRSAKAVGAAREVISQSALAPEQQCMSLERGAVSYLVGTADATEGIKAFLEKRAARFNQSC